MGLYCYAALSDLAINLGLTGIDMSYESQY